MTESKYREHVTNILQQNEKIILDIFLASSINLCRELKDQIDWDGVDWRNFLPQTEEDMKVLKEFRPKRK